jgi:hypothetical protein
MPNTTSAASSTPPIRLSTKPMSATAKATGRMTFGLTSCFIAESS